SLLVLILGGVGGLLMAWDQMPENMQTLSRLTPHAWALSAYQGLVLANQHLPHVWMACGVLEGFWGVFYLVAWLMVYLYLRWVDGNARIALTRMRRSGCR